MVEELDAYEFHTAVDGIFREMELMVAGADDEGSLDVENSGDVLEISRGGLVYLVSRRVVSRQIWVSSPVSGALKFGYSSGSWVDSKGVELLSLFRTEICRLFGVT